jgi:hypothetical protein
MEIHFFSNLLPMALVWFLVYWLLAGIIFAIIGFIRVGRINVTKFSCLFTVLTLAVAIGAVWTGFVFTINTSPSCLNDIHIAIRALWGLFKCATAINIYNAIVWFVILLIAGVGAMFISTARNRIEVRPQVD